MSRKHAALVFVPLLSGAAIIGAGFSTWYFTQSSEVITNQFSAQISGGLHGGVFTFASEATINFDQNEISYVGTTDAFVGFGYVQHAAAKEIQVEFSQDKEGNKAGVVAEWGYVNDTGDYKPANDIATYLQTLDLGTPDVGYYTIEDTESESESLVYEVYYVVFTNGNNHAAELLVAFKTALAAAQFQDVEGNEKTLGAEVYVPESLIINNTSYIVIQTGSMEEANPDNEYLLENDLDDQIKQYSLIGIEHTDFDKVELYDVIAFHDSDGNIIVHRVVGIHDDDGERTLQTRGDSNNASMDDEMAIAKKDFIGTYDGYQNYGLGITVTYLRSTLGIIALCGFGLFLLAYSITDGLIDKAYQERIGGIAKEWDYKK